MIRIENVSFSYGDKKIYDNFSLEVADGCVLCLLGESGCGKTTLIKMISSLVKYEGAIVCDKRISCVFEEPSLLPNLTVKGNLSLVERDIEKITAVLKAVGIEDKINCYPSELSGGEKQRVSLARAFLHGGETLLLDEPFSSLGLKMKNQLISLFLNLFRADKKRTALFVTHDVREAAAVGDRIAVMAGGKIICSIDNTPSEDCSQYTAQAEYIEKILLGADRGD